MFAPLGLFSAITCPEQQDCHLKSCIFRHEIDRAASPPNVTSNISPARPAKRIKTSESRRTPVPPTHAKLKPHQSEHIPESGLDRDVNGTSSDIQRSRDESVRPKAITKVDVEKSHETKTTQGAELLNPRSLQRPPASHPTRMQLVKMLHEKLRIVNDQLKASEIVGKEKCILGESGLIRLALDEEEAIAKRNASIYQNAMKSRIAIFRKLKVEDWFQQRKLQATIRTSHSASTPTSVQTDEQSAILKLSDYLPDQKTLAGHGYLVEAMDTKELEKARSGLEAAQNWEECDRCGCRFQVFPGREADGLLTSGGQCQYHPKKSQYSDHRVGTQGSCSGAVYACCGEDVGISAGCATASCHVFKVSDHARLALLLAFATVPKNDSPRNNGLPLSIDCEMCYTTHGMELVRMTILRWPSSTVLEDVLVRPFGEILDFNQRYSGVSLEQYNAACQDQALIWKQESTRHLDSKAMLRIASPEAARVLLFSYMDTSTIIVGHALENDLNACRFIHARVVDTAILYPHPRGLPFRLGLKNLTKEHLQREIQTASVYGHDSKEDAKAAGDLVLHRIHLAKS